MGFGFNYMFKENCYNDVFNLKISHQYFKKKQICYKYTQNNCVIVLASAVHILKLERYRED